MDVAALLLEMYGRIPPLAEAAVDGLDADGLAATPGPGTNSIGWLIWHLIRVEDHHLSELLDFPHEWVAGEWASGCGLAPDPTNTGYGHSPAEVAEVRPAGPGVLVGYLDAVDARAQGFLRSVTAADLDGVVDRRWDPPVTLGVRLVSVADDCLQHVGQAAYVRGLLGL
jgi:hypothetical protein